MPRIRASLSAVLAIAFILAACGKAGPKPPTNPAVASATAASSTTPEVAKPRPACLPDIAYTTFSNATGTAVNFLTPESQNPHISW